MKLILVCLLAFCTIHCKNKENIESQPSQKVSEPNMEEIKMPAPAIGKLDAPFINLADAQKSIPDLENKIWHYSFALSLKESAPKDNIYKGQWLDILPMGHYTKGLYNDTTELGRYIYNSQTTLLEMRSATGSSEWKVKVDPVTMILIGTSKYGNNPWQIKLSRNETLPIK